MLFTPLLSNSEISEMEDLILDNRTIDKDTELEFLPQVSATKEWTFMVYLDADNNLENAGIDDVNEMEMIGSDSSINIIVQIDRIPAFDDTNGDWDGTRRYYITKDTDQGTISSVNVQDLGEVNMGSPTTLQNFIQWGKSNYPANRYALILWDHGSGIMAGNSPGGVCWDDSSSNDYLTLAELDAVLSSPTYSVDLIGFDACLMGAVEVHYQLKDDVDVIVASEEVEPGDGYPYNNLLGYLRTNPTATPEQLGEQIVIAYDTSYSSSHDITQAAVNPLTSNFGTSLEDFISVLNATLDTQRTNIQNARAASLEFDEPAYIDLYDFANKVQLYCSGPIDSAAQDLMNNITAVIIEEQHSSHNPGAHGLSIYFPSDFYLYSSNYEFNDFTNDFWWDEFLLKYYTGTVSDEYDDMYEENDYLSEATILTYGTYYGLILNGSDYDIYNISVASGNEIEVDIIFSHLEGDLNLYLYDPSITLVAYSESTTDNEYITYTALTTGYYVIVVVSFTEDLYQPYYMIIDTGFDDIFEDNDDWWTPSYIANNTLYTNLICRDADFYYFWATEGYLINVTIEFNYMEGDIDLYLWDYWTVDLWDYSTTATNSENIFLAANSTDYYLIEVNNYEDNMDYSLIVEVIDVDDIYENNDGPEEAPLLGYGAYTDLVCIDFDFYNVSLSSGTWINITLYFTHEEGDLDLYLLLPNWTVIAWSYSYTDNETIFYYVTFTGIYSIWVDYYDFENFDYTLSIHETTSIWDDQFEENDYFDQAYSLPINSLYTNLTSIDWDVYSITPTVDTPINIYLLHNAVLGDLDLFLFNSSEVLLYWSATYDNQEYIMFTPEVSETYIILVYNYENNMEYTLGIEEMVPPEPFTLNSDADDPDTDGSFLLSWTSAAEADSYTVYYSTQYITLINETVTALLNETTNLTFSISDLSSGTYYFIIVAFNAYGNNTSNVLRINVKKPPGLFMLSSDAGDPDTDGNFTLSWTSSSEANNYSAYFSLAYITYINESLTVLLNEGVSLTLSISDLSGGTYYFVVVAFNNYGNSTSNVLRITVQDQPSDGKGPISGPFSIAIVVMGSVIVAILLKERRRRQKLRTSL